MLVRMRSASTRRLGDDTGASLIAVLGVMMIGFMVVGLVAVAVQFSLTHGATSAERTQALISAESGRDAALAALSSGSCSSELTGTAPAYSATVHPAVGTAEPGGSAGLAAGCPTAATTFVVIRSTGTTAGGTTATVEAIYPWQHTIDRIGPAVGASGDYNTNLATYDGDVIVRDGDFNCLLLSRINGSVYVLNGNANLGLPLVGSLCSISGDLYVSGRVVGGLLSPVGGRVVQNWDSTGFLPKDAIEERSSWFDLDENTSWPGYDRHVYPAGVCGEAVSADILTQLSTSGTPIVLDATLCSDDLDFLFQNIRVHRNAVVLVKNGLNMRLSQIGADSPSRALHLVQTSTSVDPNNPAPNCGGRPRLGVTGASSIFSAKPSLLIYTPCGSDKTGLFGALTLSSIKGQVISPTTQNNLLSFAECVPFEIPGMMTLGCRVDDGSGTGSSSTGIPGQLLRQTEL